MHAFKTSIKVYLLLTIFTGVLYPLTVTGIGQLLFPAQSNGSLIRQEGHVIGSTLIGQNFTQAKYFWSRPSAIDYNPLPSSGSNLGLTSKGLQDKIAERRLKFVASSSLNAADVPSDLLFASASGLDPHISLAAALHQIPRIIQARGLTSEQTSLLTKLVHDSLEKPDYALFGQERINVLNLNLSLDERF